MAFDLCSVGMLVWVVVLHWLRVCDYFFYYSVCYQQTVLIVSLRGCVFLIALFITVVAFCHMRKKKLIVISGFTCIDKMYIFNYDFQFISILP